METQQVITEIKQMVAQMEGPARELYASAYRLNYAYAILDAVIGAALVAVAVIVAKAIIGWRLSDDFDGYHDDMPYAFLWVGCVLAAIIGIVLVVCCVPRFVAPDLGAVSILRDTLLPGD